MFLALCQFDGRNSNSGVKLYDAFPAGGGKAPPRIKVEPSPHSVTNQHTGYAPTCCTCPGPTPPQQH
jgi:hypothetical protein